MKFIGAIAIVIGICSADTYDHDVGLETQILALTAVCQPEQIQNWDFAHPSIQNDVLTNFQLGEIITTDYLQCITGYDPINERNVISFRGSVNVDNFLSTNFDTIPEPYPHASQLTDPMIHPGFYEAFKTLETAGLRDAITAMFAEEEEADILVTGHSLGGALATVAALELKQNPVYQAMYIGRVDVMTFGSPRVVNKELATLFNDLMDSSWRVVYRYDIVPTVPTKFMGFYHVGTEVWYNYKRWWWQMDPNMYRVCNGSGEDSSCWGTDFWRDRLPMVPHHFEYFGLYDMSSGESFTLLCAQKGDDE